METDIIAAIKLLGNSNKVFINVLGNDDTYYVRITKKEAIDLLKRTANTDGTMREFTAAPHDGCAYIDRYEAK